MVDNRLSYKRISYNDNIQRAVIKSKVPKVYVLTVGITSSESSFKQDLVLYNYKVPKVFVASVNR